MVDEVLKSKIFWLCLVIFLALGLYVSFNTINQKKVATVIAPGGHTDVISYTPPTSDLPKTTENGYCFANSVAAPYRADAWRCMVGNSISDPCFQIKNSSDLLCNPNPLEVTSSQTFVLKLTEPLSKPVVLLGIPPTNRAWFVELADGTICTPFTGTYPFASNGYTAQYGCNSKNPGESMLFNGLNDQTSPWTSIIGSLVPNGSNPPLLEASSTVPIKAVWQ